MTAVRDPLLAIVGPTAVGKSALALRLAETFGGEIVSADSRQVYRYMNIGTGKPSIEDRSAVPHHLIDVVDPDEGYNLATFLGQAREAIQNAKNRRTLPILVGGTGQYIWALMEGWQLQDVAPDPELRRNLQERARTVGPERLYAELARLDPGAAARIDGRNIRRVVRALELCHASPGHVPCQPRRVAPPFEARIIGLTLDRSKLYQRIDIRIDAMIASGWLDEVRALLERGYDPGLPSLSSLGYRELIRSVKGELSLEAAVTRLKLRTHGFARRQYSWFRLSDERIGWFDSSAGHGPVESDVRRWLDRHGRA